MANNRHEFSAKTKSTLAKRVGFKCSNPNCKRPTSGPSISKEESVNIGVAAHIIPASINGPRAEDASNNQRKDISNGIWLCQSCSILIDKDPSKFTKEILYKWKENAEKLAESELDLSNSDNYYFYNNIFFRIKIHAIWAAFFDLINWHYNYENNQDYLVPDFSLLTEGGSSFRVFILEKKLDLKLRREIGQSTNFSKNILVLNSNPFPDNTQPINNIIGMSSIEGLIKDSNGEVDFEFCTSIVSSKIPVMHGTNIYNLCTLEIMFHDLISDEGSFCLNLWKEAKMIIG